MPGCLSRYQRAAALALVLSMLIPVLAGCTKEPSTPERIVVEFSHYVYEQDTDKAIQYLTDVDLPKNTLSKEVVVNFKKAVEALQVKMHDLGGWKSITVKAVSKDDKNAVIRATYKLKSGADDVLLFTLINQEGTWRIRSTRPEEPDAPAETAPVAP